MLNNQQLRQMLEMQWTMNAKINPEWVKADYCFMRAVFVECAECCDHLNFKWWLKKEPNIAQARMELVDIWHFMLSHFLQVSSYHQSATFDDDWFNETLKAIADTTREPFVYFGGSIYRFADNSLMRNVEVMGGLATQGVAHVALFGYIMEQCGMDWDELYSQYVGKGVLNHFRQDFGYKQNTYVKIWHGEEDNVHLVRILGELDAASGTFKDDIYSALEATYATVEKAGIRKSVLDSTRP